MIQKKTMTGAPSQASYEERNSETGSGNPAQKAGFPLTFLKNHDSIKTNPIPHATDTPYQSRRAPSARHHPALLFVQYHERWRERLLGRLIRRGETTRPLRRLRGNATVGLRTRSARPLHDRSPSPNTRQRPADVRVDARRLHRNAVRLHIARGSTGHRHIDQPTIPLRWTTGRWRLWSDLGPEASFQQGFRVAQQGQPGRRSN